MSELTPKRARFLVLTFLLSVSLTIGALWLLDGANAGSVWADAPARPALAPLAPSTTEPLSNALDVPVTSTVVVTFDEGVDLSSVTTRTFAVYGSQSPIFTGTYTTTAPSTTVVFDPDRHFFPGERLEAIVTTETLNLTGAEADSAWVWHFWATVSGGTGSFVDSGQTLSNATSYGVALGDLDGDGDLDAFVANYGVSNTVWLNDGHGGFEDRDQVLAGVDSTDVALGDLDHDGDLDAFVANDSNEANKTWLNDGSGSFSFGQDLGSSKSMGVALGDLDGDGDLDAFVTNRGQANKVWLNDGLGNFSATAQTLGSADSRGVALGDVDRDGDLDAFVVNATGQANRVWSNQGDGQFDDSGQTLGTGASQDVALGDLDGDGDLDAYVANYAETNQVWLNTKGAFTSTNQALGTERTRAVVLGDFDDDGDLDVYEANDDELNRPRLNDETGRFESRTAVQDTSISYDIALGDLDGDGDLDAFVANANSEPNLVWFNENKTDLKITKKANVSKVDPGQTLTYTLEFVNQHASDVVTGTIITDSVPPELYNVTYTSTGVLITPTAGVTYVWQVAPLQPKQKGIITITGVVTEGLDAGDIIQNRASFFGLKEDVNTSDNRSNWANVTVQNVAPVAVSDHFTVEQGTVHTEPAPGVLGNDYDPNGETALTVTLDITPSNGVVSLWSAGGFTYTPTVDFYGWVTFTYIISDSEGLTDTTSVTITVQQVNQPPTAVDDSYSTYVTTEDTVLTIDPRGVLLNDTDVESDSTELTVASPLNKVSLGKAIVVMTTDGGFMYDPTGVTSTLQSLPEGEVRIDSFTYRAYDGEDASTSAARVYVTVTGVNDAPEAVADKYTTARDVTLSVPAPGQQDVLFNDIEIDAEDTLTATLIRDVTKGTLDFAPDGSFVYTPTPGMVYTDTFTYQVTDGMVDSNVTTVTVRVVLPTDADLKVSKDVDNPIPDEGYTVMYTLEVLNIGPANATRVVVADSLPGGLAYVSDDGAGAYSTVSGEWDVGDLSVGVSETLRITVTVNSGTRGQTIVNTAEASADQDDPDGDNSRASASIKVTDAPPWIMSTTPQDGTIDVARESLVLIKFSEAISKATLSYAISPNPGGLLLGWNDDRTAKVFHNAFAYDTTYTVTVHEAQDLVGQALQDAPVSWSFTTTKPPANVGLAKVVNNSNPDEGDTIVYTLVVTNAGPEVATGVVVSDTLPAGVTYEVSGTTQGRYDSQTGFWTVGALEVNGQATLEITATVDAGTAGMDILNTARISALDQVDQDDTNDVGTARVTVQGDVVALAKTVSVSDPSEGEEIVYTLRVVNRSEKPVTTLVVSDTLPEQVVYVTSTASQGAYIGSAGAWDVGTLGVGVEATATAWITVRVAPGTASMTVTNTAIISAVSPSDMYAVNNRDTAVFTVTRGVDLVSLDKTVDRSKPAPGGYVIYTLRVVNHSTGTLSGVLLSDTLPAGVVYSTSTASQGTYTHTSGQWRVGDLPAESQAVLYITAEVTGTLGTVIVNRAAIVEPSPTVDPVPGNNAAEVSVTLSEPVDVVVSKDVDNVKPLEGETIGYTIWVTNTGPGVASGVVVSDTLPRGVRYQMASAGQGVYDQNTGVWTVGELAADASVSLRITCTVEVFRASVGWHIINTAALEALEQTDLDSTNDVAQVTITVLRSVDVDLALSKTVMTTTVGGPTGFQVYLPLVIRDGAMQAQVQARANETIVHVESGESVVYMLQLKNTGPATATGVVISEAWPVDLTYVRHHASQGVYTHTSGTWRVASLQAETAAFLYITATVQTTSSNVVTLTNTALISTVEQVDPLEANNEASASIVVGHEETGWSVYLPLVVRLRD